MSIYRRKFDLITTADDLRHLSIQIAELALLLSTSDDIRRTPAQYLHLPNLRVWVAYYDPQRDNPTLPEQVKPATWRADVRVALPLENDLELPRLHIAGQLFLAARLIYTATDQEQPYHIGGPLIDQVESGALLELTLSRPLRLLGKPPQLVQQVMEAARNTIDAGQYLPPTLLCQAVNGQPATFILEHLFAPDVSPAESRMILQAALEEARAISYVLVAKAWRVKMPGNSLPANDQELQARLGLAPGQSIMDHPDHEEIIAISYQELVTGTSLDWHAPIHRHGDEVWLGRFEFSRSMSKAGPIIKLFDSPGDVLPGRSKR